MKIGSEPLRSTHFSGRLLRSTVPWALVLLLAQPGAAGARQSAGDDDKSTPPVSGSRRPAEKIRFDIPRGHLADALTEWSRQSGLQVLRRDTDSAEDFATPQVSGTLSAAEALDRLLADSGLKYEFVNERTVRISLPDGAGVTAPAQPRSGQAAASKRAAPVDPDADSGADSSGSPPAEVSGVPEILIKGSTALNMDVKRSRDDAQPYVIFEREAIESSGATNIEDFLKNRLTMNTVAATNSQAPSGNGNMSQINLRGLGTAQTLILVDGHRTASPVALSGTNSPVQTDLNGIPLAAVERIEVLPTTASGIYGGGATGGVINIVLRKDYSGVDVKLNYGNTFNNDVASRRVDLSTGFNLENGRTNVLLAGSYSDTDALAMRDRNFAQLGRATILADDPAYFLTAVNPPLGTTTNIRSLNGSPLFGPGTPSFTYVPAGYAGGAGLAPLQANAGKYNLGLANSAQEANGGGGGLDMLNQPSVESLSATIRRRFTDNLEVFVDTYASDTKSRFWNSTASGSYTLAASAPNNPFGQSVQVTVPISAADSLLTVGDYDRRVVGGFILQLPAGWSTEADYTWERFRFDRADSNSDLSGAEAAAIGNGSIDVLRDTNAYPVDFTPYLSGFTSYISPVDSTFKDATARFSGPMVTLPAGPLMLSALVEHRDETYGGGSLFSSPTVTLIYPERSQSIDSAYLGATLPVVSKVNRLPGVEALDLELSGRWDEYSVHGAPSSVSSTAASIAQVQNKSSSTNPTVALRYQPIRDVTFRASYGTGFLAPSVSQLTVSGPIPAGNILDPLRGNERNTTAQAIYGGNANLRPEESKSRSAGIIVTPRVVPDLRLSVDYTEIEKTDNISQLSFQDAVDNEAFLAGRVTRGPVAPADPYGVGPITFIDDTSVNLSKAKVAAYDAELDYQWNAGRAGSFDFYSLGTWQTHYETQTTPVAPVVENVGVTSAFPLKFKANAGLTWKYRSFQLGWSGRYFDSYLVSANPVIIASQGSTHVASQNYHDLFAIYHFGSSSLHGLGMLSKTEIQFGVRNVFNTRPPFDVTNSAYFYSPYGDPSLASYYLTVRTGF